MPGRRSGHKMFKKGNRGITFLLIRLDIGYFDKIVNREKSK